MVLANFGKEIFLFHTPVRGGDASDLSGLKEIPTTAMAKKIHPSLCASIAQARGIVTYHY